MSRRVGGIIHAGSAGGYFKTGWTVNVEDGGTNPPVIHSPGAFDALKANA
jgi:hypothetical protein